MIKYIINEGKAFFLLVLLLVPLTIHSFLSFTFIGVSGRAQPFPFLINSCMLKLAIPELLPEQGNKILKTETKNCTFIT